MTGLDIEKDQIIEMACLITDSDLNILAEGPNLIIKQPDELLDSMSDWCKEHHGKVTVPSDRAAASGVRDTPVAPTPGFCPIVDGIKEGLEENCLARLGNCSVFLSSLGALDAVLS